MTTVKYTALLSWSPPSHLVSQLSAFAVLASDLLLLLVRSLIVFTWTSFPLITFILKLPLSFSVSGYGFVCSIPRLIKSSFLIS